MSYKDSHSYTHDLPTKHDVGPEPEDFENKKNLKAFLIVMACFAVLFLVVALVIVINFDLIDLWSDVEAPTPVTDKLE